MSQSSLCPAPGFLSPHSSPRSPILNSPESPKQKAFQHSGNMQEVTRRHTSWGEGTCSPWPWTPNREPLKESIKHLWLKERDEKVWCSPKACKRPQTSIFLLKTKTDKQKWKQNTLSLILFHRLSGILPMSPQKTEPGGRLRRGEENWPISAQIWVTSWCFGAFARSLSFFLFFFFFFDGHVSPTIFLRPKGRTGGRQWFPSRLAPGWVVKQAERVQQKCGPCFSYSLSFF